MASVSGVAKVLSNELGEDLSFVKQVARELLDDGLLPKSRGRDIAQVDDGQIAMLILAVITAAKVNQASTNALRYFGLSTNDVGAENGLFGQFLVSCFRSFRSGENVNVLGEAHVWYSNLQIEVVTSYPCAFVRSAGDPVLGKAFEGDVVFAADDRNRVSWPSAKPRKSVTIPGHCLWNILTMLNSIDAMEAKIGVRDPI